MCRYSCYLSLLKRDAGKLGYGKVAINSLFVLVAIIVVGLGLIAINRRGKMKG